MPSDSTDYPSISADAKALLAEISEGWENLWGGNKSSKINCLNGDFVTLARLPPEVGFIANTHFSPRSALKFLSKLSEGKSVAECCTESILGIDYRTHLNVLGRIKAGQEHLKIAKAENVHAKDVETAVNKLASFEEKFLGFLKTHADKIDPELEKHNEKPQKLKIFPLTSWQDPSLYSVHHVISYARFDHKGRDLRDEPEDDSSKQKQLSKALEETPPLPKYMRRFLNKGANP